MTEVRWKMYPLVTQNEIAQAWLRIQGNLQLAPKTMEKMEEQGKHGAVCRMNIALHITYLAIVAAVVIGYLVVYGNRSL